MIRIARKRKVLVALLGSVLLGPVLVQVGLTQYEAHRDRAFQACVEKSFEEIHANVHARSCQR